MTDYKHVILEVLGNLGKEFEFKPDANWEIDHRLPDGQVSWYPTYLVVCDGLFYMFRPFSSENFLDEEEIAEERDAALDLVDSLKAVGVNSKLFFITDTIQDVDTLKRQNLPDCFGILHNELENPLLDFKITTTHDLQCKVLKNPLVYLASCKNLQGAIGVRIREFAKKYLDCEPDGQTELDMIQALIKDLLSCDERFKLTSDPIDFMADIEKVLSAASIPIREHYFHALNTMMIGFVVIDTFYETLCELTRSYGEDIALEFIWVLTSLYHDIGYPASRHEDFTCQSFGFEPGEDDAFFRECAQETRSRVWESVTYRFSIEVLDNLFSHISTSAPGRWVYDGFPHQCRPSEFKKGLRASFVELGAHGAAGALLLTSLMTKRVIADVEVNEDREFIYRHVLFASASILFHDSKVRDCFRANGLNSIEAKKFPLSLLLTYVDVLQDDRRDMTGSSSLALFKGVDSRAGKIVVLLEKSALTTSNRLRLREQLEEALSFFAMNGLTFDVPEELREEGQ